MAIVGAIRIGGPSWLRALVGRARENIAAVEVELMSSTSHEVGELWNGQAIVRMPGKPEVQQIVYLKAVDDDERKQGMTGERTFGLFTIKDAQEEGFLMSKRKAAQNDLPSPVDSSYVLMSINFTAHNEPLSSLFQRISALLKTPAQERLNDEESPAQLEQEKPSIPKRDKQLSSSALPKSAPNISLNLHGGSKEHELHCVAAIGIVLQLAILAFSGLTVYYPPLSNRLKKNGSPVMSYAYPLTAMGTIMLAVGMMICAAVIEQSTEENVWEPEEAKAKKDLDIKILWLQKSHVVSDQTFDSFVLFGRDSRHRILTSQRTQKKSPNPEHGNPVLTQKDTFNISNGFEAFTLLGTLLGLCGFVLQFEGLRGMNWSASIAQLVGVFVMTSLRAWIRRGLIITPLPKKALDQHEMDWLTLRIARREGGGARDREFWPTEQELSPDAGLNTQLKERDRLYWEVSTGPKNLASSPFPIAATPAGREAVMIRQRLGQITKWTSNISKTAIAVARAIDITMKALLDSENEFIWTLKILVNGEEEKLTLRTEKKDGRWKTDSTEIEAILSLWAYDIRTKEAGGKVPNGNNTGDRETGRSSKDWLQQDAELVRRSVRILGPDTEDLRRDIRRWIDDGILDSASEAHNTKDRGAQSAEFMHVGFMGLEPESGGEGSALTIVIARNEH